jgi:hypothetical protein
MPREPQCFPPTLKNQMIQPAEVRAYELFWNQLPLYDAASRKHSESKPVHDMGLVPMINKEHYS